MRAHHERERPLIGEALYAVQSARYQFGTIAHAGEDLEHPAAWLRLRLEGAHRFLSRPGNAALIAAAIIAAAAALDLARGWRSARRAPDPLLYRLLVRLRP